MYFSDSKVSKIAKNTEEKTRVYTLPPKELFS